MKNIESESDLESLTQGAVKCDLWHTRDKETSSSSDRTSTNLLEVTALNMENESRIMDSEELIPSKIIDQVSKLCIGRKRGRLRKYEKVFIFAGSRKMKSGLTNEKNGTSKGKQELISSKKTPRKDNRRKLRQSKLRESEIMERGNCILYPLTIIQKRYCTYTLRNSTRTPYLYISRTIRTPSVKFR